jgi:hypothetical protein
MGLRLQTRQRLLNRSPSKVPRHQKRARWHRAIRLSPLETAASTKDRGVPDDYMPQHQRRRVANLVAAQPHNEPSFDQLRMADSVHSQTLRPYSERCGAAKH